MPTAKFRGEGGAIFEMALPLPQIYQDQVDKGLLTPIKAEPKPTPPPAPEPPKVRTPDRSDPKHVWVDFVVNTKGVPRDQAERMTKLDLVGLTR